MTSYPMGLGFIVQVAKEWIFVAADICRVSTTGVKMALLGWIGGIWHVSFQHNALSLRFRIRIGDGYGRLQRLGVRVQRLSEYLVPIPHLYNAPQV